MGIILIIISYLLTRISLKPLVYLFTTNGACKENYEGKSIPISMGLSLWIGILPSLFLYYTFFTNENENKYIYFFILTATVFVGLVDDLLGNHLVKGIKGHILTLVQKGELTSGAFKAIIISFLSLLISFELSSNISEFMINFGILILSTNSFNLLDVRPGRALKAALIYSLLLFLFFPGSRLLLSIFIMSIIAYAPWDFKGKVMLGDTGSNFLGMFLGLFFIINLTIFLKFFYLGYLIIIHIYTEKKSLSDLIEKVYILRLIDNLGR